MNYSKIINRAIEIAWRYKSLWIFGMFASGGAFNFDFNYLMDEPSLSSGNSFDIFDFDPGIIMPFMFSILIFGFVMFIIYIIANAAIIDSTNKIERGGVYSFSSAFSSGLDFFWRFLGINIVQIFASVTSIIICGGIIGLLFLAHTVLGIISLLIFIPVIIFIFFIILNIFSLAERVLVVRNVSIGDSLEEGYILFKNNFSKNLIIFLIFVGFSIGFSILIFLLWMVVGIPIGVIIMALNLLSITAFIAAFIISLPVSLLIGGILGVFYSNLYTLFYFELVEPNRSIAPQSPPVIEPIA